MNIAVVMQVVMTDGINYLPGLLRRCRIIQIHQRVSVDLLSQYGKVGPNCFDIKRAISGWLPG